VFSKGGNMQSNYFVVGAKSKFDAEYQFSGATLYPSAESASSELESLRKALKDVRVDADLEVFHVKIIGVLE
jgi:hypothetical protein